MSTALYRYRATLSSRWRAYTGVAVLLGVLGGITLGAIVSARRTASAVSRFVESTNPSDLSLNAGPYDPEVAATIAALPEVTGETSYVAFNVALEDESGALVPNIGEGVGSLDGRFITQDRLAIVDGRLPDPDRADEVAINQITAQTTGIAVGDHLSLAFVVDEQLEGDPAVLEAILAGEEEPAARQQATVVGVGIFNVEIAQDESDQLARLLLTPAFTQANIDIASYGWQGVQLADPENDVETVVAAFAAAVPPGFGAITRLAADDAAAAHRTVRPLVVALAAFAAVAGIVTVLLVSQGLIRLLVAEREDTRILRSIGASPRSRLATMGLGAGGPILVGVLLSMVVAFLLSPFATVGPTAAVEPEHGFHLDRTAVLGGGVALLIVMAVTAGVAGWLELRQTSRVRQAAERRSRTGDLAARAGLPPSAVTGVRLALEPGRGRSAVPVRAAAFGAVVAVAAVAAALTFRSSLDTLGSRPELYGWSWDVTVVDDGGYGFFDLDEVGELLADEPAVSEWGWMYFSETTVDGRPTSVLAIDPSGTIAPPVLRGRSLASRDEVVLGGALLEDLGKSIGDDVEIGTDTGLRTVRVVGTAALPALGRIHGAHASLGDGIVMPDIDVPGRADNIADGSDGPPALLLRMRDGTGDAEGERITSGLVQLGIYPGSAVTAGVLEPAELVNRDHLGTTPALLAGGLSGAALASLGLTLAASVRRRRPQLSLLKVLGFTSRQVGSTIAWQALVTVGIGLLVGLPVGVAGGRTLWRVFADELHVVARATVPGLVLAAGAAGALVAAIALSAIPALVAARTRTATVLRAE